MVLAQSSNPRDLLHRYLGLSGMSSAYSTRDGLAFIPFGSSFSKIIDRSLAKESKEIPEHLDGRIAANQARTGKTLARSGNHIRIKDVAARIGQFAEVIGGAQKIKLFTFTFPESTPDDICRKILNITLTRWRKSIPKLAYLWVAERQKNGTLHYHLLTDRWIDVRMVNGWIQSSLRNLGSCVPWKVADQVTRYNGFDVAKREDGTKEKFYTGKGAEKYVIKYLTKTDLTSISQPWHCSRNISRLSVKVRLSVPSALGCILNNLRKCRRTFDDLYVLHADQFVYVQWPSKDHEPITPLLVAHNLSRWRDPAYHLPYRSPAPIAVPPKVPHVSTLSRSGGSPVQMQLDLGQTFAQHIGSPRRYTKSARLRDIVTSARV
jgi:hypothetical protein